MDTVPVVDAIAVDYFLVGASFTGMFLLLLFLYSVPVMQALLRGQEFAERRG